MRSIVFLLMTIVALSGNADTNTYVCNYPRYSDQTGNNETSTPFKLTFIVNIFPEKSYMIGNNGATEVRSFVGEEHFSLIEITPAINLMLTTINSGLVSVHSRNTVIYGEIVPTQYYGKCIKK